MIFISYIANPKKMNIIVILEVLKKYSDENNKLTQKEIAELVEREYSIPVDRHTLKRNLDNLLDFNCGVERAVRDIESGESGGWYFERDITDAEMRMLIDGLLFSKYIPFSECKGLIKKLENQAGVGFKHSHNLPENRPENKEIFLNIEELLIAISTRKKVAFHYMRYHLDKSAQMKLSREGKPRRYVVSPVEIVITNGRYYMICIPEKADCLFHFRLDHMCDVEVLKKEKRRSIREIPGYKNGFKLADYMNEHPYMSISGKISRVVFKIDKKAIGHVLDWFGKDVSFMDETKDTVTTAVTVNEEAMLYWALQYGQLVEILSPPGMRKKIRDVVIKMNEIYR